MWWHLCWVQCPCWYGRWTIYIGIEYSCSFVQTSQARPTLQVVAVIAKGTLAGLGVSEYTSSVLTLNAGTVLSITQRDYLHLSSRFASCTAISVSACSTITWAEGTWLCAYIVGGRWLEEVSTHAGWAFSCWVTFGAGCHLTLWAGILIEVEPWLTRWTCISITTCSTSSRTRGTLFIGS